MWWPRRTPWPRSEVPHTAKYNSYTAIYTVYMAPSMLPLYELYFCHIRYFVCCSGFLLGHHTFQMCPENNCITE